MKHTVTNATAKGPRPYQEDRLIVLTVGDRSLLVVLDGHGGAEVAELCAQRLKSLGELPATEADVRSMVQILAAETADFEAGSTLSMVSVTSEVAVVAVLGDSSVIIMDQEQQVHVSPEHNVRTNLAEREAAIARGGRYYSGYIWGRWDVGLQMSRVLGDAVLDGILSREPEVYTIANPRWVLVASDGLFDPAHEASAVAIEKVTALVNDGASAQDLINWATEDRGLEDNATAVLWRLER